MTNKDKNGKNYQLSVVFYFRNKLEMTNFAIFCQVEKFLTSLKPLCHRGFQRFLSFCHFLLLILLEKLKYIYK